LLVVLLVETTFQVVVEEADLENLFQVQLLGLQVH
jgi:hypothetical protein